MTYFEKRPFTLSTARTVVDLLACFWDPSATLPYPKSEGILSTGSKALKKVWKLPLGFDKNPTEPTLTGDGVHKGSITSRRR